MAVAHGDWDKDSQVCMVSDSEVVEVEAFSQGWSRVDSGAVGINQGTGNSAKTGESTPIQTHGMLLLLLHFHGAL